VRWRQRNWEPPAPLSRWTEQADIDGGNNPKGELTTMERKEIRELRRENRRLKMEAEILKEGGLLCRGSILKRYQFIEARKEIFPIRPMCRCLKISSSGYYSWRKRGLRKSACTPIFGPYTRKAEEPMALRESPVR